MNALPQSGDVRTFPPILARPRRRPAVSGKAVVVLLLAVQLAACGGGGGDDTTADRLAASGEPTAAGRIPATLWGADGLALATPAEARPRDPAAHWSAERYATREQLALERLTAAPYTVILEANDEDAIETALAAAGRLRAFSPDAPRRLGLFVRSGQTALATQLAERLTREQGWLNVFVVY